MHSQGHIPMNLSLSKCEASNYLPFICGYSQRLIHTGVVHSLESVVSMKTNIGQKALEGSPQHLAFLILPLATAGPRCYSFP